MADTKKISVCLVGVGALGSFFAEFLRSSPWLGELTLVDFDRIEAKNIPGQNFPSTAVGKFKAVATAGLLYAEAKVRAQTLTMRIDPNNCRVALVQSDLIVDCTDNQAARLTIRDFGLAHKVPTVHAGIDAFGQSGMIRWGEHLDPDQEGNEGATCENGENRAHHAMVAALLFKVVRVFATTGHKIELDITGSVNSRRV